MDFRNFDFGSLDPATRDETLARLSYPVVPDFNWDSFYPIEPADVAWQQTDSEQVDWQQTNWQQTDANAHALVFNEPQGALPPDFQGQTYSPSMLVEFHPDFKTQVNDKIHYNIVPWLSTAATETHTPAAQSTNTGTDASRVASLEPRDSTRVAAQDLRRIEEARAAKCCTWKDCSLTLPFSDDATLKTHLECHAQDVIQRWSGESGCKWSGCASKEIFKRLSSLKLHLENVHVKPLLCARLGCSFKRPFRNLSDLQRHVKSKHSQTGVVRCPYKECMSSTRTFVRKDKWLQHVQDAEHQLDNFCPVRHCEKEVRGRFGGFKDPKEVIKHMFNEHAGTSAEVRDFSCAIGGCEAGGPPFLTKDQLRRHLQVDHSLMWHAATEVIDAVEATEIHQVQAQLVPTGIKFAPCELCSLSSTSPPLNDGKFKLAPLDQSQVACLERFPDFAPERRRGSFYDSPPPRPRRQRSRKVIYCCQCYTLHNHLIDLTCSWCLRVPHEFCSNCVVEIWPESDHV